jgi:hypothetical protein
LIVTTSYMNAKKYIAVSIFIMEYRPIVSSRKGGYMSRWVEGGTKAKKNPMKNSKIQKIRAQELELHTTC